jgi:hypothetical protein
VIAAAVPSVSELHAEPELDAPLPEPDELDSDPLVLEEPVQKPSPS